MLDQKDKISCDYLPFSHYDVIPEVVKFKTAKSYLEIGCADDGCFSKVHADIKVGVDPQRGGTHRMTSDEFFDANTQKFDVIFIDGMHTHQQVMKDFQNAKRHINADGVILFHDVLPDNRYTAWPTKKSRPKRKDVVAWNGDVWRINFDLLEMPGVDYRMVPNLHGVGVLKFGIGQEMRFEGKDSSWEFFHANWTKIPTLRSIDEIKIFLD